MAPGYRRMWEVGEGVGNDAQDSSSGEEVQGGQPWVVGRTGHVGFTAQMEKLSLRGVNKPRSGAQHCVRHWVFRRAPEPLGPQHCLPSSYAEAASSEPACLGQCEAQGLVSETPSILTGFTHPQGSGFLTYKAGRLRNNRNRGPGSKGLRSCQTCRPRSRAVSSAPP